MPEKVRPLRVVPDSEDISLRKDLLGTFDYSQDLLIQLSTRTPNATIYYLLEREGTEAMDFSRFDDKKNEYLPYDPLRGIMLTPPIFADDYSVQARYRLRAYAICPGMENSELLERHYTITRKAHCQYMVMPLKNSGGISVKNAYHIRDYDNDNIFLFNGEKAALLFDTGFYAKGGSLRKIVRQIIGPDKQLYVVMSHNGPDHIQMTWQFVDQPNTQIYINDRDRYMLEKHIREMRELPDNEETKNYLARFVHNVKEGDVFDLGDRSFLAMEVPGHTFGCVALLDTEHGDLLSGDCIGANPNTRRGSLWMWNIVPRVPINDYLSVLYIFIDKLKQYPVREIYGGHYNRPADGEHLYTYLDNLRIAAEKILDYGLSATEIATCYPAHAYVARSLVGDQFTNPYYASIVTSENIMYEPEYSGDRAEKNTDLCYLKVSLPGERENLLITQPDSGLGVSLNYIYHNVSPAPEETLYRSRTRVESPRFRVVVPEDTRKIHITPISSCHFSYLYVGEERIDSDYIYEKVLEERNTTVTIRVVSEDRSEERFYSIDILKR